jgi:L-aminoadipate-semialdehyde dehydrogenase
MYQQMNEASSMLSHHLVEVGIEHGEVVVMVYAHCDVDLIVAVMGVLKAGTTVSVIGQAYLPDRQKIYLESGPATRPCHH